MGPYTKRYEPAGVDECWTVAGGGGRVIARLGTEVLADVVLAYLLEDDLADVGGVQYPEDVPLGHYGCKACQRIFDWRRGVDECPSCGSRRVAPIVKDDDEE